MKIGIDARVLDRAFTGTGRYLINILNELPNQDSKNKYVLFTASQLDVNTHFYKIVKINKTQIPHKIYSPVWLNYELPNLIRQNGIDILFSPNILVPLVNLGKTKKVAVLHDVIPKVYPEYYPFFYKLYLSMLLPASLRKTDALITVSEFSKKDIVKYFGIAEEKVKVVYNTASNNFYPRAEFEIDKADELDKLKLPSQYILYVGAIEKRKNIICLLKTMDILRENGNSIELVIVGKGGFDSKAILPEIQKRNYVRHIPFINDDLLKYVYNKSFVFMFPSYYEGFGIPPLEAMQSGTPVITSNTSSLAEVVGEGGMLYDPEDFASFATAVVKLQNDSVYYEKLKTIALEQAKKFNIQTETKKLINIFNEA
ncbi:MAG: Glycosyltransferase [Ignavibacteria bacterium]|nr:MAG: Glycosyltransferase [Ignavibacteria bacterium]KAF0161232.1 MAG: Glycosyltransferase [Ignavibacteria bacterium]